MRAVCDTLALGELFEHVFAASPWPLLMLGEDGSVIGASDEVRVRAEPMSAQGDDLPLRQRAAHYLSVLSGRPAWLTPQEADCNRQRPSGEPVCERLHLRRTAWGASLAVIDQTRLRQLQVSDVQTVRLAALGFMVAGVCHEVTNPLTSLSSIVQLLRSDPQPTPERMHTGLDHIAVNVRRILDISHRLVRFSRTGDEPRTRFPIDEVLDESLAMLQGDGRLLGIEVRRAPDAGARVFGNRGQVQEIVVNLIVNAIQAMDGRGRLEVSVRRAATMTEVTVRDSGPGVPPQLAARIFEPFFSTKAPSHGTGLGLAICTEIAHEHGGRIELLDTAGAGACFRLSLPTGDA